MKWFEGSINEAVTTSKSRKAIFVVFVEGKDETSTQFTNVIDTAQVSSQLEREDFVAIKIEGGSESYRLFAQIYHLVPIPSLFFIGENGTPLSIEFGEVTVTDLILKIEGVLTKAGKKTANSSLNLIESEQKSAASSSSSDVSIGDGSKEKTLDIKTVADVPVQSIANAESENKLEDTKSADIKEAKPVDIKGTDAPTTSDESKEVNNATDLTIQEKLDRAKQLIEEQKKQRQEEEEKKEKERELERRRMGRDVQKLKLKQQDLEVKQAHEERMKEKAEEAAAREKVRQQIAQDKLERKQKELALQQQAQQQQPVEQPKVRPSSFTDVTLTRIQFRLPSGNPHMAQFSPADTLRTLRTYVAENINLPFRHFVMSTSFPRRDLTAEDDSKTLLDLDLVPRAVILILPLKNNNVTTTVASSQNIGFGSRFVWLLIAPVIGIYNYLIGYFYGTAHGNSEQNEESTTSSGGPSSGDGSVFSNLQNVVRSTGRNIDNQGGTTIRAQGNIHRLHSGGDDNDENNTWNGNSTQQM